MMWWDPEALFDEVKDAVYKAGGMFARKDLAARVHEKGLTDFVTQVDIEVQSYLKGELARILPGSELMGEEKDNSDIDFAKPVWILDPVDGTTNLMHGFRHSAVSLALVYGMEPVMGLIYDPFAGELFSALKGSGAYLNGQPVHTSAASSLADALINVGTNSGYRAGADMAFKRMRAVYDRCHGVRAMGAASVALAYVAAGRLEGYVEARLKPWDYAAGILLVREAGGEALNFSGEEPSLEHEDSLVAASALVAPELLSLIQAV